MKIVLYCTKLKLNEAIDNSKAKIDIKLNELVLKHTKSKLNQAISVFTKAGNLELKIDVQYVYQAKLGRVTRNYPNWKQKWVF
jgi:hypothetical protein